MNPQLTHIISDAHTAELRRQARADRLARRGTPAAAPARVAVTIRAAYADDASDVSRIAELDGDRHLTASASLVAEIDGVMRAVLFADGSVISDPFIATAGAVELLRLRARQTGTARRRRRIRNFLGAAPFLGHASA